MASSMRAIVPLVFLLLASIVAANTDADVSCDTVMKNFLPCVYVASSEEPVFNTCCNGLRKLGELCSTPSYSQPVCNCLKPTLIKIQKLPPDYLESVASYPGRCRVNIPYKLDPSTDCDSLN